MNFEHVLGLSIYNDKLKNININQKLLINTISPNSFTISENDKEFKAALKNSDILVLDGLYFGLASILLKGVIIKKNSGTDCFYHFMNIMNEKSGKVFFLGSSIDTLTKIKERAKLEYPNIMIEWYSPPFSNQFSTQENLKMINTINDYSPDVLFVGMTAPKQEKWAYKNKNNINTKIICTIGNVFDWYAGNQKQPEKIWVTLGLEWLIRTIRRPEILKRYPNVFIFFWIVLLNIIKKRND